MNKPETQQAPVAIVGISCIFAKSPDLKSFYHLLAQGVDGITDPPDTHQQLRDYYDPDPKKPDHIYCNRGGYLPTTDFDPTEFSIPPNVIEATDTSQLLGLVTAKRALADAGYGENSKAFDRSKASVILGVTGTQELVIPLGARLGHPIWRRALEESGVSQNLTDEVIQRISNDYVDWQENSFPGLLGNVVAGRIANRLDFGGTNCVVDAACASSFGAMHMALLELRSGRSNLVLAGGVDTINDAFMHMCFSKTQILSSTGDVRPFSDKADGTVLGEGIGMVVLKRLADAESAGDRIYAVIKGIGSASDGNSQSIYAPRASGQAKALRRAYRDADIDPASVALMEAHGTGTRVGDQIEFKALCDIFGAQSPNGNRCALGSVKSNIGHTKAAAGTAGLIKTALSIYHKVLPPTLKADKADPKLGVEGSPFYLNTNLRPWLTSADEKRRAGVSAFGFGGSNFHAVLEEYNSEKTEASWDGSVEMAAFSGSDRADLLKQLDRFSEQALDQPGFYKIGKLAKQSRRAFDRHAAHRMVMVLNLTDEFKTMTRTCEAARQQLTVPDAKPHKSIFIGQDDPKGGLAFLFPGQGSQYTGMGRELVCSYPSSLKALQDASVHFDAEMPLGDYIYPRMDADQEATQKRLRQTWVAQPAIGAVSVALLKALTSFGIAPDATCGHSYGELVALHAAGWMTQEDLWALSVTRGRLMADAGDAAGETGTMMAVKAPIDEIETMIRQLEEAVVVLANRNSTDQGVLSGTLAGIDAAEKTCAAKGWRTVRLPVAAAFHSPIVAEAQKPFGQAVSAVQFTPGSIVVMSNTLGSAYPTQNKEIQSILGRQLASPVNFSDNIESLYGQGMRAFVEVGPKTVLTQLVNECLKGKEVHTMSLDRSTGRGAGIEDLAAVLANLAALGYAVDLNRWEKPFFNRRKARMAINLSGANYRNPQSRKPANAGAGPRNASAEQPPTVVETSAPPRVRAVTDKTSPVSNLSAAPATPRQPVEPGKGPVPQNRPVAGDTALGTIQQGLASMQALQAHTSRAHEKFLETQAEASRTLQQMIQGIQRLADPSGAVAPLAVTIPAPITTAAQPDQPVQRADRPPVIEQDAAVPQSPQTTAPPVTPDKVVGASKNDTSQNPTIEQTILQIVSRLTGYPEEMLGLEMDIEADLGIDSIKRVEILSALEEQMPELPKVTPDMMGTLKTLGQICDFLSAGDAPTPETRNQAAPPSQPVSDDAEVSQTLVAIVSELTGYPAEMLGLEMDIEADLGIDSIKRVEILSALEEQMPQLPKVTPDLMGTLKTLGQIIDYLIGSSSETDVAPATASIDLDVPMPMIENDAIGRQVVTTEKLLPLEDTLLTLPEASWVAVAGDSEAIAAGLIQAFAAKGIEARHLKDPEDISSDALLAGLVMLAPLAPQRAFRWARTCHPLLLMRTAGSFKPFVVTASFLDGAFGFKGGAIETPIQGALAGLIKTAAIEWPQMRCLALDIDPQWDDAKAVARSMVAEISWADAHTELEIGLSVDDRVGLRLTADAISNAAAPLDLSPHDVVVVTGGARGVTAAAAIALADHTPCAMALLGRSPEPTPEPDWLKPLTEEADIKKAILANAFQGQTPSPKEVEAIYRRLAANRQIAETIYELTRRGAKAAYYSVDVRDTAAVNSLMETVRQQIGPICGVIHGAGVLEDRLIVDKQPDQFEKVYATKVDGLHALLEATRKDILKYLVLFSSISARMGNQGQVDYAMANEVLNKVARQKTVQLQNCRVVSINWGPWDGGMVSPSLKRNFLNNGVALIPLKAGARAMVSEMALSGDDAVEVVIGGALPAAARQIQASPVAAEIRHGLSQTCKHRVNVKQYPVLQSHLLDGRPVVPLALITEWLAHSAMHDNPGLSLLGMDQLRLLKGITLDREEKLVRMMAGKAERKGHFYEVDVEIRNGVHEGRDELHSSAKAILTDRLPSPPVFNANGHLRADNPVRSLSDIYERVLFHGQDLRGIRKIIRISDDGMSALLASAPPPASWVDTPLRSRWIADPLVLDCAFQMAIIWCHEQLGQLSLPSYAASYRQYIHRFPKEGVTAVLEIQKRNDRKLVGDFTFLDQDQAVVASLKGYEAIMDPLLVKAFKAA